MLRLVQILLVLLLLPQCGCAWLRGFVPVNAGPQAPRVLAEQPTLDQIITAVNNNTARVQTYSSSNARISSPGLPGLRANIAIAQPQQFRLRADMVLSGTEVDLGSNPYEFWFWVKRSQPPALYYSSHEQFANSPMRNMLPIEPTWLIEAMGLVTFDATAQHSGPRPVNKGQWEVRSDLRRPAGDLVKLTIVDGAHAWVLEQHVYTAQGERIASAVARNHRFDPTTGVSLPQRVDVQIPRAQLNLNIDIADLQINRLTGNPQEIFARPTYQGVQAVDLGSIPAPIEQPLVPADPRAALLPASRLPPP